MPPPPPARCGPGFGPCTDPGQCCNPTTGTCTTAGPRACSAVHALLSDDRARLTFATRYDAPPAPLTWAAAQTQARDEMIAASWREGGRCTSGIAATAADAQLQAAGVGVRRCGARTNATCPWRAGEPDLCCVEEDHADAPMQGTCLPCDTAAATGRRVIVWNGAWMYA